MRFLFCCEFYYPSVGGVQEVMRQLAERMVERGHEVTVATTLLKAESFTEYNGVRIEHFAVTGNNVRGIHGEAERYRDFVLNFPADAILIKAAQQWTFDALFPVLDQIRARKIFIPCGFSGLYEPAYKGYFEQLPASLAKFDNLIFYANHYRDIDFCRSRALEKLTFIPNGASEREFHTLEEDPAFRKRLGIAEDAFLFSTVGSMTGVKGHREIAEAFARMESGGRPMVLVLNGNQNLAPKAECGGRMNAAARCRGFATRAVNFVRREGAYRATRRVAGTALRYMKRTAGVAIEPDILQALKRKAETDPLKKILILDLPRGEVIELFKSTDLFVFASNIEYSPLVLFEAAAAGTPFLTVPVGNAEEIASMTGAGQICSAERDGFGYTRADPDMLASHMARMMNDPALLQRLGQAGRRNWEEKYSWDKIASQYEALLTGEAVAMPALKLPLVSVVLPVFNGGTLLQAAVRSILAQTLMDFELLVVDDGSTDKAVEAIRALQDPRIRVIGDEHRRGLSARLNEGIHEARGRYIARMDADDIAFPHRLEKQVQFLDSHPDIDLAGCRAVVFGAENMGSNGIIGMLPFAPRHEEICAQPWRGFPLPHPTWMGRASWFRRFRYAMPEIGRAEDQELLLRSFAHSRFACIDEVLLAYRQGPYRLRRTLGARWRFLKAQEKYFIRHNQWKNAALALILGCIKVAIDLLAALPGCDRLFFARMGGSVPDQVLRDFAQARAAL